MDSGDRPGPRQSLIHHRDPAFTAASGEVLRTAGQHITTTSPKTPPRNAICERITGTLRRELPDQT